MTKIDPNFSGPAVAWYTSEYARAADRRVASVHPKSIEALAQVLAVILVEFAHTKKLHVRADAQEWARNAVEDFIRNAC